MYGIPEDGTDVSKHVATVKYYTDVFVTCAIYLVL